MKNITTIIAALVLTTLSINSIAQNTANSDATASARIVTAIDITKNVDLNFGILSTTPAGGTVTITAEEEFEVSYSANNMEVPAGSPTVAKFTITGEEDAAFGVNVPASITLTEVDGSNTMTIATAKNLLTTANTLEDGSVELYVGGVLTVGANQAVGNYSGDFNVTVSYE